MRTSFQAPLLLIMLLATTPVAAQLNLPDSLVVTQDVTVKVWPPKVATYGLVWVPNATYGEKTGFGLGAETVKVFRLDPDERSFSSTVNFKFMGTTKGQWRAELGGDLYWNKGKNYAQARVGFDDLARPFYGLGPAADSWAKEYYRPNEFLSIAELSYKFGKILSLGPRGELHHQEVDDVEEDGLLDFGVVPGLDADQLAGLGVALVYDTRDNRYYAGHGQYIQARWMAMTQLNSDHYEFDDYVIDARSYFDLNKEHILAGQVFFQQLDGTVPFWRLASLGHENHSWAYGRDRYLDKMLIATQVQWRWKPYARWGFAASAGVATVAQDIQAVVAKYWRPSAGISVRYFVARDGELVPIRLDLGVGYQSVRVVAGIGELF